MSSKPILALVLAALVILWLADIGVPSEYAWLSLAFIASAAIAVLAGMALFMGLSWAWVGTLNGRIIPMAIIAVLGLLWIGAMVSGHLDRGPEDCGGPTRAGYVC